MLHGDISNIIGATIAFRCEDSLFKPKEGKLVDFLQKIAPSTKQRFLMDSLSEEYLKAMEYIYRNTEYTVDLVINEDNYTPHVASVLEDLPFNRIIKVRNEGNISARLLIGDITIYVDESTQRRGYVNSKYAVPLKELSNLIKRRA
jgi:hypothetical protein